MSHKCIPFLLSNAIECFDSLCAGRVTAIILCYQLGMGVLALPYAMAVLGWVPFLVALTCLACGAYASGLVYARLYCAAPHARVLADVALMARGALGERVVSCVTIAFMIAVMPLLQVTLTLALPEVFPSAPLSAVQWSGLISTTWLVLGQVRHMRSVGTLSILGSVAMIIVCATIIVALLVNSGQEGHTSGGIDATGDSAPAGTSLWGAASCSASQRISAFMSIVYSFGGQNIFIELQGEMEPPAHFTRSVGAGMLIVTSCYAAVACVGYVRIGETVLLDGKPITSHSVGFEALDKANNILLAFHVLIAALINLNVLTKVLVPLLRLPADVVDGSGFKRRAQWLAITGGILTTSFTIANTLPFFTDIIGLLGSLFLVLITYTIPCWLALALVPLSPAMRRLCQLTIPLSLALSLLGASTSLIGMLDKFKA